MKSLRNTAYICLPIDFLTTDEYRNFRNLTCFDLYMLLRRHVIRSEKMKFSGIDIYKEYYTKGLLVSKWTQEEIGKKLRISQSAVSKQLRKLDKLGYIKIKKYRVNGSTYNIYQLGTQDSKKHEIFFMDEKIGKCYFEYGNIYKKGNLVFNSNRFLKDKK